MSSCYRHIDVKQADYIRHRILLIKAVNMDRSVHVAEKLSSGWLVRRLSALVNNDDDLRPAIARAD